MTGSGQLQQAETAALCEAAERIQAHRGSAAQPGDTDSAAAASGHAGFESFCRGDVPTDRRAMPGIGDRHRIG